MSSQSPSTFKWKLDRELGLGDEEAKKWEAFSKALKHKGIFLMDSPYEMVWKRNTSMGIMTGKNTYDAIKTNIWTRSTNWCHNAMWKWDMILKIKVFTWLLMENRILTWENLQIRGWKVSRICAMCKKDIDTSQHLMLYFPFAQRVWTRLMTSLKIIVEWTRGNIFMFFNDWRYKNTKWITLPSII
jgi:hypothetical protein